MLLSDKVAVIYGGGGAIGAATAGVFAREGASVFLAGRRLEPLERVAHDIRADGGRAGVARVDALDEEAVERHVDAVVAAAGRIDIALNALGIAHVQGAPLAELSMDDFLHPVVSYARANFIIARAVARPMARQGSGTILTLSTPGARLSGSGFLGNGVASAAVEAFSRILAGELGPAGIRTICLRPDAIPEAVETSHTREAFAGMARRMGASIDTLLDGRAQAATLLKRLPKLADVAEAAAFVASDRAGTMTGTVLNLSCGSLVD